MTSPAEPALIRAVRFEDAEAIAAMRSLPGVRHGTLAPPFPMVETSRKWLQALPKGDLHIVAECGGAAIGNASLNRRPGRRGHCGSIGIMVHDGRGIGTALMAALVDAADQWLGLLRLELEVNCDNAPALALYRRFGFVVEGRLVANAFRSGEYIDCFTMGRLAGALAERRGAAAGQGSSAAISSERPEGA